MTSSTIAHPTTDEMIEMLRGRGYFVRQSENRYDRRDMVRRESAVMAGPLKLAAYRVRDAETDEWSKLHFHMTYDNTVIAAAGEEAAKLFANFVTSTLEKGASENEASRQEGS